MKYLLLAGLCVFSINCLADDVYVSTDKNGNMTYSDIPFKGAKKIDLPPLNQTSQEAPPPKKSDMPATGTVTTTSSTAAETETESGKKPYTEFLINSPLDKQTIPNQPEIPVAILISPDLQPGDKIQLYFDGQRVGEPAAKTGFTLDHPDRGTHQLYATLINSDHAVIKQTQTITIYIRYSALGPANRVPPPSQPAT